MIDPMVQIKVEALEALIRERTALTVDQFYRLIAWDCHLGDMPASRRRLAWDILSLDDKHWSVLRQVIERFPQANVIRIDDVSGHNATDPPADG